MASVQFWGAAQTVTGSMHLLKVGGKRLLLDCGLYQGRRKEAFEINRNFPFDPSSIDALVLSHAHIDHSGNIPSLVRSGFKGPIYSTSAARELAVFLLLDSAKIQVSDVKYINRKRKNSGRKPFEPLYTPHDANIAIRRFRTVEYHFDFEPIPGVRCQFFDAGHMLGSAIISVDIETEEEPIRLVFSGDVGREEIPILREPETVPNADYLIMESTYGDRTHPQNGDATSELLQLANEAFANQGKLIIPAFSVGRTQEIVYRLNELAESGQLPDMPVFVDSPLAINATTVFQSHPECFDDESFERILMESDQDPLNFENLHFIHKATYSKELNRHRGPAIIISSSGMCESGRVVHHLKHHIEDPSTIILFSGYQAPYTLGRKILDGAEIVSILGVDRHVRAKVARLDATSGHADQPELVDWAVATHEQGHLRKTMLVHGELDSATSLSTKLQERGIKPVLIPARGEEVQLSEDEASDSN